MTIEVIIYGCFNVLYMSIIEGLHSAIKNYTKFGVAYELITLWCAKEKTCQH